MSRLIVTALAVITGIFALMFSLVIAIPLAFIALIQGKRFNDQLKRNSFNHRQHASHDVIEGEYEEVIHEKASHN
ncbi:hypothetical protein F9817_21770 [Vibrio sp. CAIM 722]|uniref:Hydroxylamine reductase n=1 Tax=Vibrio eleionomae TaxID=2653505 RepID=A0A7X4LQ78_9VIBR|nr:hypothetical protein [Vibrio eleionomae]MZI95817.1 hypothetical protein [Vibrio eleionomae]